MLIVNVNEAMKEISEFSVISLDSETTGFYPYLGHELFSIIIATKYKEYYFNYNKLTPPFLKKTKANLLKPFKKLLSNPNLTVFMHNAKFDWHFLAKEGIEIKARVICTQSTARLVRNNLISYSLASLGELIGYPKDDGPKIYMDVNKLFEMELIPGKKKKIKNYFFNKVPLNIMQSYGEIDARVTYNLGVYELERIKELDSELPKGLPQISQVLENEIKVTRVLFEMERAGIKVNEKFIKRGLRQVEKDKKNAINEFEELTGVDFKDSGKVFKPIFDQYKLPHGLTEKGAPSFDVNALEKIDHPISKAILKYRDSNKRANTYLKNFLYFADNNDLIHCDFNQNVLTGRLSCRNPNMQNINNNADEEIMKQWQSST